MRDRRFPVSILCALALVLFGLGPRIFAGSRSPDGPGSPDEASVADVLNMAPGDVAVRPVHVTVSAPTEYHVGLEAASFGDQLAARLILTITSARTSCADPDPTILYQGGIGEGDFHVADDAVAGSSQTLCVRTELPIDVDNAFQGATTTIRLTLGSR